MKPICLIAARGGSRGVPGKNVRLFAGKPLIAHTIVSSLKSNIFSHVIVSTDNKEIARIAKKYGAEVPFLRPKNISSNKSSMAEVIEHTIKKLKSLGYDFNELVNRDCTAPFIQISDVKKAVSLLKKTKCDTVAAGYKTHLNPYFNMMEVGPKRFLEFSKKTKKTITSRQNVPVVYQLTGFQVINVTQFLKYKKIYMPKTLPIEIRSETGLMIDTEFEFDIASCIAKTKTSF
tara:strand:+ start:661 stop:1356 length:696 start_codon:yes stop_codon:yes gene_type:complete